MLSISGPGGSVAAASGGNDSRGGVGGSFGSTHGVGASSGKTPTKGMAAAAYGKPIVSGKGASNNNNNNSGSQGSNDGETEGEATSNSSSSSGGYDRKNNKTGVSEVQSPPPGRLVSLLQQAFAYQIVATATTQSSSSSSFGGSSGSGGGFSGPSPHSHNAPKGTGGGVDESCSMDSDDGGLNMSLGSIERPPCPSPVLCHSPNQPNTTTTTTTTTPNNNNNTHLVMTRGGHMQGYGLTVPPVRITRLLEDVKPLLLPSRPAVVLVKYHQGTQPHPYS